VDWIPTLDPSVLAMAKFMFMVNWKIHQQYILVGGFSPYPSERYDGVKVSWDDDIPNMMGKIIHSCSKPPSSHSNFPLPEG
jgi:hypothetical protein